MKYGTLQAHEGAGHQVRIGFLTLTTKKYLGSSTWQLINSKGEMYRFTPYNGLEKY